MLLHQDILIVLWIGQLRLKNYPPGLRTLRYISYHLIFIKGWWSPWTNGNIFYPQQFLFSKETLYYGWLFGLTFLSICYNELNGEYVGFWVWMTGYLLCLKVGTGVRLRVPNPYRYRYLFLYLKLKKSHPCSYRYRKKPSYLYHAKSTHCPPPQFEGALKAFHISNLKIVKKIMVQSAPFAGNLLIIVGLQISLSNQIIFL